MDFISYKTLPVETSIVKTTGFYRTRPFFRLNKGYFQKKFSQMRKSLPVPCPFDTSAALPPSHKASEGRQDRVLSYLVGKSSFLLQLLLLIAITEPMVGKNLHIININNFVIVNIARQSWAGFLPVCCSDCKIVKINRI